MPLFSRYNSTALFDIDVIPRNFDEAKRRNSARLKEICNRFGSSYARRDNVGVSQNWT